MLAALTAMRLGLAALLIALPEILAAQGESSTGQVPPPSFRLHWENDMSLPWESRRSSDRSYTQGLELQWSTVESPTTTHLPFFPLPRPLTAWLACQGRLSDGYCLNGKEIAFGQTMYTPRDITQQPTDPLDRPYGGFTYLRFARSAGSDVSRIASVLQIGGLGDISAADRVQRYWHKRISSSPRPEGWEDGLPSELGIIAAVEYDRVARERYRGAEGREWRSFDATFKQKLIVGNVFDLVGSSMMLRYGYNLANPLPTKLSPTVQAQLSRERPVGTARASNAVEREEAMTVSGRRTESWWQRNVEFYAFAGPEIRLVAYNAFLDGNLFASEPCRAASPDREGPCVRRQPLVADVEWGLVARLGPVRVTYRAVHRSREFAGGPTHRFNTGTFEYIRGR